MILDSGESFFQSVLFHQAEGDCSVQVSAVNNFDIEKVQRSTKTGHIFYMREI